MARPSEREANIPDVPQGLRYRILEPHELSFGRIDTVEDVKERRARRVEKSVESCGLPGFLKEVRWNVAADVTIALDRLKKQAKSGMDPTSDEVHVYVPRKANNLEIVRIADTHLGDDNADGRLDKVFEYAMLNDNVIVSFHGDIAAGVNAGIPETMINATMPQFMQVQTLRERYILPLFKAGKLGPYVRGYYHHDEWGDLLGYMFAKQVLAGTDVPIVTNTGRVIWHFADGQTQVEAAAHNAGGGASRRTPLAHISKMIWNTPGRRSSLGVAADKHTINGASRTINIDGTIETRLAVGAAKVNDAYLQKRGIYGTSGGGGMTISRQSRESKRDWVVSPDDKAGSLMAFAYNVLDLAEKNGVTREVIDAGLDKAGVSGRDGELLVRMPGGSSRVKREENLVRQLDEVSYFAHPRLPLQVLPVQNLGIGTSHSDEALFDKVTSMASKRRNVAVLIGRNMLSPKAEDHPFCLDPKHPAKNRHPIDDLDRLVRLIKSHTNDTNRIGLLLSSDLAKKWWGKFGQNDYRKEKRWRHEGKLEAGTYLIESLGGSSVTPLLENEARITISFPGGESYRLGILDELQWNGTMDDPFGGLVAAVERFARDYGEIDVAIGGHMGGAGSQKMMNVRTGEFTVQVAPGGFSSFTGRGEGNKRAFAPPGHTAILLPDRNMVIPTTGLSESNEAGDALTALYIINAGLVRGHQTLKSEIERIRRKRVFVFDE